MLQGSPCEGTRLPTADPLRVEPLTTDQVEGLIAALPRRYRAIAVLGAGTGVRQGKAFGLTVDRVDFLRRAVRIDRQLQLVQGGDPYLGPPKTAKSHRTIPLPQVVVDTLAAHLAEFSATAQPVRSGSGGGSVERVSLVFTDDAGWPLRRTWFSARVWRPAASAVGLPSGVGFHALRHYHADQGRCRRGDGSACCGLAAD